MSWLRAHIIRLRLGGRRCSAAFRLDKIFTYRRIHRAPDCAITWREDIYLAVALSPPITLSETDKLDALCRLDQFRQWRSLDEKRYCLVCGKIITGQQIEVAGGTRGNGPLRLSCPTERCNSIPMDQTSNGNGGPSRRNKRYNGIASQLRKFALHLKGRS